MRRLVFLIFSLTSTTVLCDSVDDIANWVLYDDGFASAGQPTPQQYQTLADAGYQRVIYLAYADQPDAPEGNDRLAHAAGMDFLQIPIRFAEPRYADFAAFAALMDVGDAQTLVHCQVNFRASAFSFLYRVIYGGSSVASAKRDLDSIWRPNATWQTFMRATLARHGHDMDCGDCDWTLPDD